MSNTIIVSILSMAGLGLACALLLAFLSRKLKVEEDPKVAKIEEVLPGGNCGACAFPGCHEYASAVARGEASPILCKAGGEELTKTLSEILGIEIGKQDRQLAIVHCGADQTQRKKKAIYSGIKSCIAAHNTFGGEILCEYGCLGMGDCAIICPFGAIKMVEGLPLVDKNKCTACGKCVLACPRSLITIEKINAPDFIYVACDNQDKGPETKKACPVGCIACGLCQRLTNGVFYLEDALARVKVESLSEIQNPEEVVGKCPTKCIHRLAQM